MEIGKFNYQVLTNITLSKAEIDHLLEMSKRHYDLKCQLAGECGGFIYGWNNRLSFAQSDSVEVAVSIRELDLVTKILELEPYHAIDLSLSLKFHEAAQRAVAESERINKE